MVLLFVVEQVVQCGVVSVLDTLDEVVSLEQLLHWELVVSKEVVEVVVVSMLLVVDVVSLENEEVEVVDSLLLSVEEHLVQTGTVTVWLDEDSEDVVVADDVIVTDDDVAENELVDILVVTLVDVVVDVDVLPPHSSASSHQQHGHPERSAGISSVCSLTTKNP